jgi:hypothetical protein
VFSPAFCFVPGMRNQKQDYATRHTNCLPPLFAVLSAVLPCDMQRVIKYEFGGLKTNAVLALVALVLTVIP